MSMLASNQPALRQSFTPKLVTVFKEGYGWSALRKDAVAGLTVAVVALPLSVAIAIASGVEPSRGLYTAIIGGFLVSALGGSRFQIGGPAGAFIVLIASIVARHGYDGLVLATILAGALMIAVGALRLGDAIKFIPYPVIIGFTAGIAIIIFASQLKELLGLQLIEEPPELLPKLEALWAAKASWSYQAALLSAGVIAVIVLLRLHAPKLPGFIIAVALAALAVWTLKLDVATIGSRFGAMPSGLPFPQLPVFSLAKLSAVWLDAVAIAFLGGIESLLSAVVADGMSGGRHRSNCELVAQGLANIGSALFGGICVTGTIARTATNVRSGAHGPMAGIFHAAYLLLFILVAPALIALVPLAALSGLLAVVCWSMAEKHEFLGLLRSSMHDRVVLLATFGLTIFVDLVSAITAGVTLAALFFMVQMARVVNVETQAPSQARDDDEPDLSTDNILIYRITGPFFFGAAAIAGGTLDRIGENPKYFILDFRDVPFIDSTGASTLKTFVRKLQKSGTRVILATVSPLVRKTLQIHGFHDADILYEANLEEAVARAKSAEVGTGSAKILRQDNDLRA